MRYFITGATGFLGGALARQLLDEGHELTVLARDPARAAALAEVGAIVQQGDIGDKGSLRAGMSGADGVFHVAGRHKVGEPDPAPFEVINVEGSRNVLEVMAELGVPRGVYTSTLAVNSDTHGEILDESYRFGGTHLSHYDRSKWEAHELVARPMIEDGLPLIVVLPGAIYGPGDYSDLGSLIEQFLRGRLRVIPQGSAYCWAHVEDTAAGHRLAMERGAPGEEYIIAGPPATLLEALSIVAQIAGGRPPRLQVPAALLRGTSRVLGMFGAIPALAAQAEPMRVAAGVTYLGDNAKAAGQLGYAPRSLEDGFAEYIPEFMEELGLG